MERVRACSVLLFFLACTGEIAPGAEEMPGADPAAPESPGSPGTPGQPAAPGTAGSAAAGPTSVGPSSALRLLTRDEYDHTIRDLLGDTTRPGRELPPDDEL